MRKNKGMHLNLHKNKNVLFKPKSKKLVCNEYNVEP